MVLKGLKIFHFKADHHNMLSIQLVLKMHSFSLQLHSSLPHQQQYSPPKKSKTTAPAPPPQVTEPGPSTIPPLRTRLPLEPSAHHFCFSIDLRSISNLEVSSPVNCYLRWVDNRNWEGRLSKSSLFFFPGWLCHFKGLFIPVWSDIHWSKILPVMSPLLANWTVSDISRCSQHSICQSFFPHVNI